MSDIFTKEQRSEIMSSVKSKNSKAELRVRSLLHRMGFRFRLHSKNIIGKPDIVLKKHGTIIFVHGCFWHRHGCKHSTTPKSNTKYWNGKFARNIERFKEVRTDLEANGWKVFVVWECETRTEESLKDMLLKFFH